MTTSQQPINKNTPVTIGLVCFILAVSSGAIFKAGQVLTEFEYVKASIADMRSEVADLKRIIQRLDRTPRAD